MVRATEKERLATIMVEDGERVLDNQFRVWKDLDDKVHNLAKLAIVAAAFGLAIGTFTISTATMPAMGRTVVVGALAVVFTANLVALYLISHAYSSINGTRYAECPPEPGWMVSKLQTTGWTVAIHLESLLLGMTTAKNANVASMEAVSKWRRRGVATLAWIVVPGYWGCAIVIGLMHVL